MLPGRGIGAPPGGEQGGDGDGESGFHVDLTAEGMRYLPPAGDVPSRARWIW
jgi:hypothetical protein